MKVYVDLNDWWVGYYRGPNHHYVCLMPTLVIRWDHLPDEDEPSDITLLRNLRSEFWRRADKAGLDGGASELLDQIVEERIQGTGLE